MAEAANRVCAFTRSFTPGGRLVHHGAVRSNVVRVFTVIEYDAMAYEDRNENTVRCCQVVKTSATNRQRRVIGMKIFFFAGMAGECQTPSASHNADNEYILSIGMDNRETEVIREVLPEERGASRPKALCYRYGER